MVLWGVHPPAYTHRSVVRTEGYTFAAKTCAFVPRSRAVFCRPVCQTQFTAQFIRTKCITGHERARECVNRSRLLSRLLCTLAGRRLLCACGTFELSFGAPAPPELIPSRTMVWSGVSPPSREQLTHWRHLLPRGSRWRTLCSGERKALGEAFTRERESQRVVKGAQRGLSRRERERERE